MIKKRKRKINATSIKFLLPKRLIKIFSFLFEFNDIRTRAQIWERNNELSFQFDYITVKHEYMLTLCQIVLRIPLNSFQPKNGMEKEKKSSLTTKSKAFSEIIFVYELFQFPKHEPFFFFFFVFFCIFHSPVWFGLSWQPLMKFFFYFTFHSVYSSTAFICSFICSYGEWCMVNDLNNWMLYNMRYQYWNQFIMHGYGPYPTV